MLDDLNTKCCEHGLKQLTSTDASSLTQSSNTAQTQIPESSGSVLREIQRINLKSLRFRRPGKDLIIA